jgi:hypothetical protein
MTEMNQLKRLEDDYTEAFHISCKLFGVNNVLNQLPRLNEIYNVTEEKWEANLQRLIANNIKIKYLLIGEAAPWSDEGQHVKYFYNGDFNGLGDAILPGFSINAVDAETVYRQLASKQFLLIDTLPYSFSYPSTKRNKSEYRQLLKCCLGYFNTKLFDSRLQWESNVKVGFGYILNAMAVMEVMNNKLLLPNGKSILLNKQMIVADDSKFPHEKGFKRVFGLSIPPDQGDYAYLR